MRRIILERVRQALSRQKTSRKGWEIEKHKSLESINHSVQLEPRFLLGVGRMELGRKARRDRGEAGKLSRG